MFCVCCVLCAWLAVLGCVIVRRLFCSRPCLAYVCLQTRTYVRPHNTVIDLDKFGLNGEAPVAIAEARDRMIEEAPQVWELVTQSDPFIKRVLQDPFRAAEFASEAFGIDAEMPPGFSMGQSAS